MAKKEIIERDVLIDVTNCPRIKHLLDLIWDKYAKLSAEERKTNPQISISIKDYCGAETFSSLEEYQDALDPEIAADCYCANIAIDTKTGEKSYVLYKFAIFANCMHQKDDNYFLVKFTDEFNELLMINAVDKPYEYADYNTLFLKWFLRI